MPRIQSWRQHGYAVIMLDNRGTANRGVDFEAYLKVCVKLCILIDPLWPVDVYILILIKLLDNRVVWAYLKFRIKFWE